MSAFLNLEISGPLAEGPATADSLREGTTSRQPLTEQREELREAALAEALRRYGDQAASPASAYPQFDKLSTAWKLSLPGPVSLLQSSKRLWPNTSVFPPLLAPPSLARGPAHLEASLDNLETK